ncbi:hypothetical protein B7P43_G02452, partial [Cryptotermes secundus]
EQRANIKFCLKLGAFGNTKKYCVTNLAEDLGKRKFCARFVRHALSGDEKHARVEQCKDMLRSAQSDTKFTKTIVTGDERWCFQYEPLTKRQSAACSVVEPEEAETKESAHARDSSKDTAVSFYSK